MRFLKVFVLIFLLQLVACAVPESDLAPIQSVAVHTIKFHHRVIEGENLNDIAKRYGKNVEYIARVNNLASPYNIHPGQALALEEDQPTLEITSTQHIALANGKSLPTNSSTSSTNFALNNDHEIKLPINKDDSEDMATNFIENENYHRVIADSSEKTDKGLPEDESHNHIVTASVNSKLKSQLAKHKIIKVQKKPTTIASPTKKIANLKKWKSNYKQKHFSWVWPAKGKVIGKFSRLSDQAGIQIAGKMGTRIQAIEDGEVVYSGSGLRGYGKLVIIKHPNDFLSAYAHNKNLLVREGMKVHKGQQIAEMGSSESEKVMLHFELRHHGKPIDPLSMLPIAKG